MSPPETAENNIYDLKHIELLNHIHVRNINMYYLRDFFAVWFCDTRNKKKTKKKSSYIFLLGHQNISCRTFIYLHRLAICLKRFSQIKTLITS